MRRDASVALAMIGSPKADSARGKLLSVLTDTDEIDRSCVVWALAVLGEHAASDAILKEFINGTLQDKPGFEPGVIARAIGIEKLSSPEILNHEDAGVRAMTAHALAEAASPEVVDPLAKLLSAEIARNPQSRSTEVIRAATEGLGRSGDPRAAEPLFALLEAQPAMRGSVIDALSQSTAAPSLVTLLGHAKDDKTRLDLVNLLANTRDPRGADALAGMLTNADPAVQLKAALGLADLGDVRAVDTLLAFAGGPDNPKADQALFALRDVTKNGITGKLMAIVKEYPYRNASVLRALGATKDPAANGMLEGQLNGDDVGAAAMALADLGSATGFKKLMAMLPRPRTSTCARPRWRTRPSCRTARPPSKASVASVARKPPMASPRSSKTRWTTRAFARSRRRHSALRRRMRRCRRPWAA
ncbi:MAG: HEAT repeat domain-containing protein [Polyangiales bacterium]